MNPSMTCSPASSGVPKVVLSAAPLEPVLSDGALALPKSLAPSEVVVSTLEGSSEARVLRPDLDQARKFLEILDPNGVFRFVVSGSKSMSLRGTLDQHAATLTASTQQGASIEVVVNEERVVNARTSRFVRVRATFIDLDRALLGPVLDFPMRPQAIVEYSPDKLYSYWTLNDGDKKTVKQLENEFKEHQGCLAHVFKGDIRSTRLEIRVRLPGFFDHTTGIPFMSRLYGAHEKNEVLLQGGGVRYSSADLQACVADLFRRQEGLTSHAATGSALSGNPDAAALTDLGPEAATQPRLVELGDAENSPEVEHTALVLATSAEMVMPGRTAEGVGISHSPRRDDRPLMDRTAAPRSDMPPEASILLPDLVQARRFLDILDPNGVFTFQTFADQTHLKRNGTDPLATWLHGTFDQHGRALSIRNQQGAGVFVMVNEGNGAGRSSSSITRVRALFLDLDGAPLDPVLAAGAPPHLVVQSSPGKWHVYWLVEDCHRDDFKAQQQALAHRFGGDVKVCDLSRVMRLPGFYHRKTDTPFMTRLVENPRSELK